MARPRADSWIVALALAAAAWVLAPASAHAQVAHRLAVRGEFAIGTMIPPHQRQTLGFDIALQGSGRFAISLIDPLALQLSFTSWFFTGTPSAGQVFAPTIGLRLEPQVGRVGRFFVDLNLGPGWTPDRWRPYGDLGVGFEFNIGSIFSLGPVGRIGTLLALPGDFPSPAVFWSVGISMTLRFGPGDRAERDRDQARERRRERPRRDRDRAARDRDRERDRERDRQRERDRERERERDRERAARDRDPDDDGVLGDDDRCPRTAAGRHPDPERPGCPDGDADDDDVRDHADQCPRVADGLHPDPDRPGCPLPDRDDDNVPDNRDACPSQPGAPSSNPRLNGCPGLVRVQGGAIIILQPVYFAPGHERILPRSEPLLRAVAEAIRENPRIGRVSIEGHTDETGTSQMNLELSQSRANSVRAWLIAHGVDGDRLETHGYGETRPANQGDSPRARAANRRVEFRITVRRR